MKLSPDRLPYMLCLGALAALPPISTDMALPALADIAQGLGTTASTAGLTLSLFMLGFAVSPIAYGPLSDRVGRRPALLAGLVLFVLGNAVATFGHSIASVLAGRLAQGAGAGAGMTMAFAIVRDQFDGVAAQTRLATITIVANLAPIVAPAAGTALLQPVGWRGIYGVTLGCGVLLTCLTAIALAETHDRRTSASPRVANDSMGSHDLARGGAVGSLSAEGIAGSGPRGKQNAYGFLLRVPSVRGHLLVNGLGFAWMFAYVAGSSLTLLGLFHLTSFAYSMMFACTGAGIVAGAAVNGHLAKRGVAPTSLLMSGIALAVVATVLLMGVAVTGCASVQRVMPLFVVSTFSFGLMGPSATHGAMAPVPSLAGVTGALVTSIQMVFGALASTMVVLLFPRFGLMALAGMMAAAALIAAAVYWPLYRSTGAKRRLGAATPNRGRRTVDEP